MKSQVAPKDAAHDSSHGAAHSSKGGGVALAPPAYGIEFADKLAAEAPLQAPPGPVLQRQAAAAAPPPNGSGNLPIGPPDDPLEKEADQIADRVMRMPLDGTQFATLGATLSLQRKCACGGEGECEACKEEATLQRMSNGANRAGVAPASVHEVLHSPGQTLSPGSRSFFGSRFGRDFSQVRVHSDTKAAESAAAVGAHAYTVGDHVVFGAGNYSPDSAAGQRLLAHELTHVVQQGGALQRQILQRDATDDAKQKEACPSEDSVEDGYGEAAYPPLLDAQKRPYDYLIAGKQVKGEGAEAQRQRLVRAFVESHYTLNDAQRSAALRVLTAESKFQGIAPPPGCAVVIAIEAHLMDRLFAITGVELRVEKAAAEKKAREEQEKTRQAGLKSAEAREKAAGLPPPPKDPYITGDTKGPSGSEYTGPSDSKGNAPALPAKLTGPELQPAHGTGTYRMELQYSFVGNDVLSQVVEAMNWVNYHWERYDITNLVVKGLSDKQKRDLKQQAPSSDAEVGKMAATGRRAEYAYEDLAQQTESSVSDLLHPTQSATTGSPAEVANKAIANYENLQLLPVSAIVDAGGWALGALADIMGGTFEEREIPWPDKEGYYFIRCVAQPDPQGAHGEQRRAASVAAMTVEVRSLSKLAKNALLAPLATLDEKRLELEIAKKQTPPDAKEIERLTKELGSLEIKTSGSAIAAIQQAIEDKKKEKENATEYRKAELDNEIERLNDQLEHAKTEGGKMTNVIRPNASLVSKVTGQTYPLLLQLGTVKPNYKKYAYMLSDVTSRDGKQFFGEADTEQDAAWNAVKDFAYHNEYGEGIIAISMPEGAAFQFAQNSIPSEKHDFAIAKKRIDDLVTVLVILGLFVPGVGEVALVLGAAVAAEHIIERWQSDTLRFDESLVNDLIAVLSAVFAGAAAIGKLRVVRTSESFLLKTAQSVGEAAEIGNKALNYGGMIWGSLKDLNDIMADNEAELQGKITHAEARRNRVKRIASAIQTGALVLHSLSQEGKQQKSVEMEPTEIEGKSGDKPTEPAKDKTGDKGSGEKAVEKPSDTSDKAEKQQVKPAETADTPVHDADDPVAKAGKATDAVNPEQEQPQARVTTKDGLHQLFVLEDGRIIRCSLSCGELRTHYQEFIASGMKDSDPVRQKLATELDGELRTAEIGARSKDPAERQKAAKKAAELEPKLRSLAAKDLAAEIGGKVDVEKLSSNFTPDEIRELHQLLGTKKLGALAKTQRLQQQLSHSLALGSGDLVVREAMLNIVKEGIGNLGANDLATALTELGKLQSRFSGYVPPDLVARYEAKVKAGDVAGAKELLTAAEKGIGDAQRAGQNAEMIRALEPLQAEHAKQEIEYNRVRGEESRLSSEIAKAQEDLKQAMKRADAVRSSNPDAYAKAIAEAKAAQERMKAAKTELDKLPSASEEAKDLARIKQRMADVRLRMDPESRAPLPCFAASTPVWTYQGPRRIDKIETGDRVLTFDFEQRCILERPVREVFRFKTRHFYNIQAGSSVIRATGRHRFWVKDLERWIPAAQLKPGMKLHVHHGTAAEIENVALDESFDVAETFNLSVNQEHNYFVGDGFLVHNQGGFDTKLGGDITIYRGVNPNYPNKVYIGKTTDVTAGGQSRGVKERQSEHQAYAKKMLADRGSLSKDDIEFYEFMSEVQLTELVTGLTTKEQGQYLEQRNIEIEEGLIGEHNVLNRRSEITSPAHMQRVVDSIKNDPKVKAAGFCTR